MNLTDLRTELDRQADRVEGSGDLPLPVIRSKATGIRRRRIAAVAVTVGLVATALPLTLNSFTDAAPPPAAGTAVQPVPDVVRDGIRYRGNVDGDVLVKAVIGEVGQNEITFTWTPPAGQIEMRPFCIDPEHVPSKENPFDSPYWAVVRSGGKVYMSETCDHNGGADPGGANNWQPVKPIFRKLEPGKQATISVRLGDYTEAPRRNSRMRFGIGFYKLGAMRTVAPSGTGLRIPEIVDRDGTFYRLAELKTAPLANGASVTAPTPADTPLVLMYGAFHYGDRPGYGPESGPSKIRLTGIDPPDTETRPKSLPGLKQVPVAARPAGTATATFIGPAAGEEILLLAVYKPI